MKGKLCEGVQIHITDKSVYQPLKTGNMILGILKSLYPHETKKAIALLKQTHISLFNKACGSDKFLAILKNETFPAYKLIQESQKDHQAHDLIRNKYLLYD